jgi:diguanylate cyclase (GGDEF)-like protein
MAHCKIGLLPATQHLFSSESEEESMDIPRQTVLIVDDTPMNIEILSRALDAEYEILCATSGQEALEIAFDQSPDLILLDVVMPGMSGYEVCTRLKAEARLRATPVIFVSGMDHEEDEARGLEVGAIDYLAKPIRPSIVKARVRNHLELKRHRDFLEELSGLDSLTGICNRLRFDDFLMREWRRALRNRDPVSLILMEIDLFKQFNEHYGRRAGDDCLRQVAQTLADSVRRPADLVARFGNEEFACLLPETDEKGAICVANHIQEKVAALRIPHACSGATDHVTMSIGVATLVPLVGQSAFDLIRRADALLYTAKRKGRNQIRSWLDDTP